MLIFQTRNIMMLQCVASRKSSKNKSRNDADDRNVYIILDKES